MESTLTSPPDHILLTILSLLPTDALLRLRAVCTHWNTLITSRNTLRSITFLHPPSPPLPSLRGAHPVLHPVLKKITHQPDGPSLHGSPLPAHSVANSMLSRPAASTLAVWGRGGIAAVLERPAGIRVADALSLVSEAITAGFWDQTAYQYVLPPHVHHPKTNQTDMKTGWRGFD